MYYLNYLSLLNLVYWITNLRFFMLPKKNPLHYSSIYSWLGWYLPLVVNFTAGMVVASLARAPSTSGLSLGFLPIFPLMARSWCSAELLVSVNCGSHVSFLFSLYILSLSWSCLLFLFFFFYCGDVATFLLFAFCFLCQLFWHFYIWSIG